MMFGRLKVWHRVATRYDRCPTVFFYAVPSPPLSSSGYDQRVLTLAFKRRPNDDVAN